MTIFSRYAAAGAASVLLAIGVAAAPAGAQPAAPQPAQAPWPPPPPRFNVDLTLYGWLPSTSGSLNLGRFSASGEQNFWNADMLAGAMALVEANYGHWRLLLNNVYGYQRFDLNRPVVGDVTQRTQLYVFELVGGYDVVQYSFGSSFGPPERQRQREAVLTPYAGMRLIWSRNELEGQGGGSSSSEATKVAPIFGLRGRLDITERWWLGGGGDLGGSAGVPLTWSAYASVGYRVELFGRPGSIAAGYRAIGFQFNPGRRERADVDLVLHGPHIGLTIALN